MRGVRALVLTGFGINCEEEMAAAYRLAGAEADIVHLKDVFSGKACLFDYDILNFPGGFSFGDDLGAGRVLANRLKYKQCATGESFFEQLQRYIAEGKIIIGICNGFQALVTLGLLPGLAPEIQQEVALVSNDSGKFEDRWCHCVVPKYCTSPLLPKGALFDFPVRHGEGKLWVPHEETRELIIRKGLIALQYCTQEGGITEEYPHNPNGAWMSCAALTDPTGQVLGMMPHPEAYLSFYNHPQWPQRLREEPTAKDEGEGLSLFKHIVEHVRATLHTAVIT
tara:strand:- start:6431 stop:7273 length:843 start_codon:yes stop_codon:yes gene_type:complete